AHMLQHVLLMSIAAPLLVLGAPTRALVSGLPVEVARTGHRWWRRLGALRAAWALLSMPAVAWLLYMGTLLVWHLPTLYEAALHREELHVIEHVMFLGVALLFWRVVVRAGRSGGLAAPATVIFLFAAMLVHAAFSALVAFSDVAWYPHYESQVPLWGLTPLEDQQL